MNTSCKRFSKYAALNIAGMLGISCYILADTFFIANGIGAYGLAALNLAIPIYSFIHGCALMLGTGGSTKFVIAKCQGEQHRANTVFTTGMKAGFVLALIFLGCGLFLSRELTHLLKADAALYDMTHTYLRVILIFSPFFITNEQLLAYVRGDGNPSLAMTAMIAGSLANILLDYIFIFPMQMGIFGAVLATGIAPMVSMLILSSHVLSKHCGFHFVRCGTDRTIIKDLFILGFPSLVIEVSAGIVMIVFNLLIMKQSGNIGVAAYGIIANIALVTTAVFTGLAQGVQPLLSEAHSANDHNLMRDYIRYSLRSGALISIILYAMLSINSAPIVTLFNSETDTLLQALGERGIQLYFTALPFTAFNIILCAIFTAAEEAFPAHIVSLLRGLLIVLPAAFVLSQLFGINGIWITITATELLTAAIGILLWRKYPVIKISSL